LLLSVGSASAAYLHGGSTEHFGADGTEGTEFSYVESGGLGIYQPARRLYVASQVAGNSGEALISAFDLANSHAPIGGNFPIHVPAGSYEEISRRLAVDNSSGPSAGNIYYFAKNYEYQGSSFLYGFNSAGEPLGGEYPLEIGPPLNGCGVAVDGDGNVWLADLTSNALKEFSAAGLPLPGTIHLDPSQGQPCNVAFDLKTNDAYVNARFGNDYNTFHYSAASGYSEATEIDPGANRSGQLAIDSTHGVVYMDGRTYNLDGEPLETGGTFGGYGLAVDEHTGTIYGSPGITVVPASSEIPDVATGGVSNTTVQASVDPLGGGDVTKCQFEYGTDNKFGNSVPCDEATPYSGPTAVSATLPGLTPELLYHYRAAATNSHGTYFSSERTFVPHHVQDLKTEPASDLTKYSATLEASYVGTGLDTHYYFEWGPAGSPYDEVTSPEPGLDDGSHSGPRSLSAPIGGLTPDSAYHYRVIASNSQGISMGRDQSFSTASAVTGLSAALENLTGASATLTADWIGDGTDTHYYFEWGPTTVYGNKSTSIDAGSATGPQHVSVDIENLFPRTLYHYRVVASDLSGTTATPDATFKTPQLAAIGYAQVKKLTEESVELLGTVNPQDTGPTTYHFEYGLDTTYGSNTAETGPVGADHSIYTAAAAIGALAPGATYHYRLVATSTTGVSRGEDRTFTTVPEAPTIVSSSVSDIAIGEATLNSMVRPGYGPAVVYFQYGRELPYGSTTAPVGPLPSDDAAHAVSTRILHLVAYSTYHYRAVSVNFGHTSYGPDQVFNTPGLPEVFGGNAAGVTKTSAILNASVNPHLLSTGAHFIYGPTSDYGSTTPEQGGIGSDETLHRVSASVGGLEPGTTYHFRLVADNALGASLGPDQVLTTAPAGPSRTSPNERKCPKSKVKKHGKCVKRPHKRHRKPSRKKGGPR
jgi:phosphodiesterase/alkaline phosphatase D-like protein